MSTIIVIANSTDIALYYVSISILVFLLFVTLYYGLPSRFKKFSYLIPIMIYSVLIMYSSSSILATQPAYNLTEPQPYNYTVFVSQPLAMTSVVFYLGFSILIVAVAVTLFFFFKLMRRW